MSILNRLSSKIVAAAKVVWSGQVTAEKIAVIALEIINIANKRKINFFSGKSSRCLIGVLFYILGFMNYARKKQEALAAKMGTSDVTIRASYREWLKEFLDLFHDGDNKIGTRNTTALSYQHIKSKGKMHSSSRYQI